jgi:hypothetical protein
MEVHTVHLSPGERFELVVLEEGILPIPEALRATLRLEVGEVVSVELVDGSLTLTLFSAFLESLDSQAVAVEKQWAQVVQSFISRTLTCLDERGLPIAADLFPLEPGEPVVLVLTATARDIVAERQARKVEE